MKKKLQRAPKLKINIKKVLVLTPGQMERIAAGEENDSVILIPKSVECIPPFNAPPFYNTSK